MNGYYEQKTTLDLFEAFCLFQINVTWYFMFNYFFALNLHKLLKIFVM